MRQLLELHPMRLGSVSAEALLLVLFVFAIIALEKDRLAIAFESQDMSANTIEEPAIMADHEGAAREVQERFFERPERVDVQVIGRFVEKQDVAAGF